VNLNTTLDLVLVGGLDGQGQRQGRSRPCVPT
jgi:hypothetical protein